MLRVAEAEENVHAIGVEGNSDDLDVPMEALFKVRTSLPLRAVGSAPPTCER